MPSGDNTGDLVFLGSPDGSVAIPLVASSGNVAAAAAVATIAAVAAKLNYLTGFLCTASGSTTALPVNATITGLAGGTVTFTFTFPAGVLVAAEPLVVTFPTPLPASAVNTAIELTLPSGGAGNTNAAATVFGFRTA